MISFFLAAVLVGTWNGNWFPSGRAEHRAPVVVEEANAASAGAMLAAGMSKLDPHATNDVILVLNEIRGPKSASNLVSRIGRRSLRVVSVSAYRRRDRFDQQQDVIATTLPVVRSGWSTWRNHRQNTPPRGYAFADIVIEPSVTARVYAVHLKSNYGATSDEIKAQNRTKRTLSCQQLMSQAQVFKTVIIAGDFNADPWKEEFREETIFRQFFAAGYADVLSVLSPECRGTHNNARYGSSALDHILVKGFLPFATSIIEQPRSLSDHSAVFTLLGVGR